MKPTNNPLDVAIDGAGFFEIATPQGVRFTRLGAFKIDGSGQLVTKDGHPVLKSAPDGTEPASRVIKIVGDQALHIADNGEVFEGENSLGKLSMIKIANKDSIQKIGSSLYTFKANFKPEIEIENSPSLKQGFVEMSNVNVVQEMTDMIATTRLFESAQKAIGAYDSMTDKLVNTVGNLK